MFVKQSDMISLFGYQIASVFILCKRSANERRRYISTSFFIDWAHTQNDHCACRGKSTILFRSACNQSHLFCAAHILGDLFLIKLNKTLFCLIWFMVMKTTKLMQVHKVLRGT